MPSHLSALPWQDPEPRSVAARVAAHIARQIVEGDRIPGDVLTEVAIATQMGVSRTPIREALLQVESWGLVRLLPKKGAIVTAVTAAERRDLIDVRSMWETRATETMDHSPQFLAEIGRDLHDLVGAQSAALDQGDLLGFAALDCTFHLRVIEAGQNQIVADLLHQLGPRFARLIYSAVTGSTHAARGFRDDHERLATLVAAGDTRGYAQAIDAHLTAAHFSPSMS